MRVCIYIYIYVNTCIIILYACIPTNTCMHIRICMYIHTHEQTLSANHLSNDCTHYSNQAAPILCNLRAIHVCVCARARVCIYIYIYIYICTHTCMHMYMNRNFSIQGASRQTAMCVYTCPHTCIHNTHANRPHSNQAASMECVYTYIYVCMYDIYIYIYT
jgi:hypothetical protein